MKKRNFFKEVPAARVPRNMFDLSHEVKMSGRFGFLYPTLLMEVMPGDSVNDKIVNFLRAAPMLAPIMHQVKIKTDAFFVPFRLLNGDVWETFATGGQDGTDTVVLPYFTPAGVDVATGGVAEQMFAKGTLWDYFGGPVIEGAAPGAWSTEQMSVYPFFAYRQVWNDWFRDPNLEDELVWDHEMVGDQSALFVNSGFRLYDLRQRGWERESFTAALPWPQRGPEVLLPLAGTGSVTYTPTSNYYQQDGGDPAAGAASFGAVNSLRDTTNELTRVENIDEVLLTTSSITINDFRAALAMQRWMEINSRAGGRYIEQIKGQYDVTVPDYRLQRSEYLGGGRATLTISEVLSTTDTASVPVGDMAGHGISVGKTNGFNYRCQEHGLIIVILSIVPTPAYMQGLPKLWSKANRFDDLAFPSLANLGEQEMKSKEIYYSFDATEDAANNELWGYNPRYYQYKFMQDRVAGDFRDTLLFWHLARKFSARPVLDRDFVIMDEEEAGNGEPYYRIFAAAGAADYFWMQIFHKLHVQRPLSYYGVPQLIG